MEGDLRAKKFRNFKKYERSGLLYDFSLCSVKDWQIIVVIVTNDWFFEFYLKYI